MDNNKGKLSLIKNNNDKKNTELKRVHIEFEKTDIYFFAVDVQVGEDENIEATKIGWNIINGKLMDLEKVRVGNAFKTKIIKKELVENKNIDKGK